MTNSPPAPQPNPLPTTTQAPSSSSSSSSKSYPQFRTALDNRVYVCLTYDELDILDAVARVKSPSAGAVVMFAGTTRDNFDNKPVSHLSYSAYAPRALSTMLDICTSLLQAEPSSLQNPASSDPVADSSSSNSSTTATTTDKTPEPFNTSQPTSGTTSQTKPPATTTTTTQPQQQQPTDNGLVKITMIHRLGTVPIGEESILITVSGKHRGEAWRAGEEALERCKERVEVWKEEWFEGGEGVWRANRDGGVGVRVVS